MTAGLTGAVPDGAIAVRGGTVVDAAGSRRADVLVGGGRVIAVLPADGTDGSQAGDLDRSPPVLVGGGCLRGGVCVAAGAGGLVGGRRLRGGAGRAGLL